MSDQEGPRPTRKDFLKTVVATAAIGGLEAARRAGIPGTNLNTPQTPDAQQTT